MCIRDSYQSDKIDANEMKKLENQLLNQSNEVNTRILNFFKKKANLPLITSNIGQSESSLFKKENNPEEVSEQPTASKGVGLLKNLANKMKTRGQGLLKNVQNIIPGSEKNLAVAKVAEAVLEGKQLQFSEEIKQAVPQVVSLKPKMGKGYDTAIVYFVDGGSYVEYQALSELAAKLEKNIFYGGADILSPKQFLNQFEEVSSQFMQMQMQSCLLYTSPSPRDRQKSRMPSSA
eukprot:TRINITY_DN5391_c0_g1_i3.p2 TRINITY_DN5391_c0_g1~~TRINITY_DN5391_c0_g1_i3.p2  ORF type:complete len:233 (+),score=58.57 TRINITY_DN5391_c0_g1_i3:64-762(+)